jgi:hypothetical protein
MSFRVILPPAPVQQQKQAPAPALSAGDIEIPVTGVRKAIAANMHKRLLRCLNGSRRRCFRLLLHSRINDFLNVFSRNSNNSKNKRRHQLCQPVILKFRLQASEKPSPPICISDVDFHHRPGMRNFCFAFMHIGGDGFSDACNRNFLKTHLNRKKALI